ncbi:MAG: hypothetical protein AAF483_29700 [Planctomycetota bacterium]
MAIVVGAERQQHHLLTVMGRLQCSHGVLCSFTRVSLVTERKEESDSAMWNLTGKVDSNVDTSDRYVRLARTQIALQEIEEEQRRVNDLSLRDLKSQFGIRHLLMVMFCVSVVCALHIKIGISASLPGLLIALLFTSFWLVSDWQAEWNGRLEARKKELEKKRADLVSEFRDPTRP